MKKTALFLAILLLFLPACAQVEDQKPVGWDRTTDAQSDPMPDSIMPDGPIDTSPVQTVFWQVMDEDTGRVCAVEGDLYAILGSEAFYAIFKAGEKEPIFQAAFPIYYLLGGENVLYFLAESGENRAQIMMIDLTSGTMQKFADFLPEDDQITSTRLIEGALYIKALDMTSYAISPRTSILKFDPRQSLEVVEAQMPQHQFSVVEAWGYEYFIALNEEEDRTRARGLWRCDLETGQEQFVCFLPDEQLKTIQSVRKSPNQDPNKELVIVTIEGKTFEAAIPGQINTRPQELQYLRGLTPETYFFDTVEADDYYTVVGVIEQGKIRHLDLQTLEMSEGIPIKDARCVAYHAGKYYHISPDGRSLFVTEPTAQELSEEPINTI